MSETQMPAAEAEVNERHSYELAFHVLPTVAEGEVSNVFDAIKSSITKQGGELTREESPERFELAYEVIKHIDGKNRKFTSAYFGWVRFTAESNTIAALTEEVDENTNLLRHMLIKLTKAEEAEPFYIHKALASVKTVTTVDAEAPKQVVEEAIAASEEAPADDAEDAAVEESK